ncbi:MAG: YjbQ family protein, partial [Verrucomicrobia bacterium]|nr:YjbQ family protein [Verrucomicrobiota bacterium]
MWLQKTLTLSPRARGFHLVTREIMEQLPELGDFHVGLAHFF